MHNYLLWLRRWCECGGALLLSQRKSQTNSLALKREAAALSPQALGTIAMLIQTALLNLRMCSKLLLFNAHPFLFYFNPLCRLLFFRWSCIGKHLEGHYAKSTCTTSELFTQACSDLRFEMESICWATRLASLHCVFLRQGNSNLLGTCYVTLAPKIVPYPSTLCFSKVNTEASTFKYLITL